MGGLVVVVVCVGVYEWVGWLPHVCVVRIVKTGCNLKINREYLLGATSACDTLSCVLSQFTGTA